MNNKIQFEKATQKMSRRQAKIFWNALTPEQRADFSKMMQKLQAGKLELEHVAVDDNEQIQRIVLKDKKSSAPIAPFAKEFNHVWREEE